MSLKQKLVVIGNGMAGARTLEEILSRGGAEQFDMTVIGAEPYGNYNRLLLSNVLSGNQTVGDVFLNPLSWYEENDIRLKAGVKADSIDRVNQVVSTEDGEQIPYDKLIIATGSRPFVPRMEGLKLEDGSDKPGVFLFRTLDDCEQIAAYAKGCKRAAVIGGGLLGLEAAKGLLTHGPEVHLIHLMPWLMENQLDKTAGGMLRKSMEKMGLCIHLEKATRTVLGSDRVTGLAFADGEVLDCCMVVISCGISPNVEIARECGLTVERAIVTDDQMRSVDDPNIYVVGECAQHRGKVYGLVAPLCIRDRFWPTISHPTILFLFIPDPSSLRS